MNALELKLPPLVLVVITALLMWGLHRALPLWMWTSPLRPWFAGGLFAAGAGFALAGVIAFRRARTTVDPRVPDAASRIVSSGIYRYSRNPMYVGFLLALAAWALWLASPVAALCLPAFVAYMNRFQIAPEERMLGQKFGAHYLAYRQAVRRWL